MKNAHETVMATETARCVKMLRICHEELFRLYQVTEISIT